MKVEKSYTLNSKTTASFEKKHPWIFNGQIAPKNPYKDGDFLQILSIDQNKKGVGIFSKSGLISIRVIHFGENFTLGEIHEKVIQAIQKRKTLIGITDSFRWIHGENDFFPGITIDQHGDTLLVMAYSRSLLLYARYVCRVLNFYLNKDKTLKKRPANILLKFPRRIGKDGGFQQKENYRILRGVKEEKIKINFRKIVFNLNPNSQKGGTFDDLRNLRNFILDNSNHFKKKKVLNLFSNNGLTSIIFEKAGAKEIYSVDDSESSLKIHRENLENYSISKHKIIKLNIFKKLEEFLKKTNIIFDVILIDPPSLTSSSKDIIKAKQVYKKLIELTLPYLGTSGIFILCSCSNRIHKNEFERICKESLTKSGKKFKKPFRLSNEPDHPVIDSFPEGDYLKVHIYAVTS